MKPNDNTEKSEYSAVLGIFIEGQKENTKAIKNTESSLSRLENTVTEFVVEARHTNKKIDALNHDIHGEGGIVDQMIELKLDRRERVTIKKGVRAIIGWVAAFASGYLLFLFKGD